MRLTPKTQKISNYNKYTKSSLTYVSVGPCSRSPPHTFPHSLSLSQATLCLCPVWLASFLIPIKSKYMHINNVIKIKTRFGSISNSNSTRFESSRLGLGHLISSSPGPLKETLPADTDWSLWSTSWQRVVTSSFTSHARFQIMCTHLRKHTHTLSTCQYPSWRAGGQSVWGVSVCLWPHCHYLWN